jgi:hypothetical protein
MCVLTIFKDKTRSAAISSLEPNSANRFNTCVSRPGQRHDAGHQHVGAIMIALLDGHSSLKAGIRSFSGPLVADASFS